MSTRKRRVKKRPAKKPKPGRTITSQQSVRLQQAIHAHNMGNLTLAEAEYRALIAAKAKSPQLYSQLALACAQTGRREEADRLWKLALDLDPDYLDAEMNLADSYQQSGDQVRAAKLYRRVIASHEYLHVAKYLLANILKSKGKMDEAADLYRAVMEQQPDYTQAHFTYSGIHKYKDNTDPHLKAMLELNQSTGLSAEGRTQLAFALAKACEDIGDYSQAFSYLSSGNDLRYAEFNYEIDGDQALMESIARAFSQQAVSRLKVAANPSTRPIFIIGMPRSGTSLVEKILASHTAVYGAGELHDLFALGARHFLRESGKFQFQALDTYAPETFEVVGNAYIEQIAALNSDASRVCDKLPFNFMMAGIIRIALPNAKIIHCVRDAKDNCLSIFKQNFTTANYRFAYNLKTIAQFHNQYRKLMRHWHDTMPGAIYDLSYESLAREPEQEIRKLLDACDLDFQESCVRFEKTEAVVKTASAFQVRQPMYTSSVGLWQKYGQFLGPLLDELADD